MIQSVVTTDEMLEQLRLDREQNDQELISYMTKLVQRLKTENLEQGIKVNQMVRFSTKKRTIRGSIAPHKDAANHPARKGSISDLDDLSFAEVED